MPRRVPSKTLMNEIIRRFANKEDISLIQAQAICEMRIYDCFKWQKYEGNIVILADPEYKKQLNWYLGNVKKYANCGEIVFISYANKIGFMIGFIVKKAT